MADATFSAHLMRRFVETLSSELGQDTFFSVLSKSGLPEDWAYPAHFETLDDTRRAQTYARLQATLRTYYGRGARGILRRIGVKLWSQLLADANFGLKTRAMLVRGLPGSLRHKPALELLARLISNSSGDVTVHTLDLDLLLVDHASPTTLDQTDDEPICFVTLGLIRECLFWAGRQEYDIEERACRALGASQCEFKITISGG